MISASDPRWNLILVAIPLAHLTVSALYVSAWCIAFGCGISSFFNASDLFTFSIARIVPIYLSAMVAPAIVIASRYTMMTHPTAFDAAIAIQDNDEREKAIASLHKFRKLFAVALVIPAIFVSLGQLYLMTFRYQIFDFLVFYMATLPPIILMTYKFLENTKTSRFVDEVIVLVCGLIYAAVIFGLSQGQSARYATFPKSLQFNISCNGLPIIVRLSDYLLVVQPDGSKLLVDKDCRARFAVPEPSWLGAKPPNQTKSASPLSG